VSLWTELLGQEGFEDLPAALAAPQLALALPAVPAGQQDSLFAPDSPLQLGAPDLLPLPDSPLLAAAAGWQQLDLAGADEQLFDESAEEDWGSAEVAQPGRAAAAPDSVQVVQPLAAEDAAATGAVEQLVRQLGQMASPSQPPPRPAPEWLVQQADQQTPVAQRSVSRWATFFSAEHEQLSGHALHVGQEALATAQGDELESAAGPAPSFDQVSVLPAAPGTVGVCGQRKGGRRWRCIRSVMHAGNAGHDILAKCV
jgi:hypothetical protein